MNNYIILFSKVMQRVVFLHEELIKIGSFPRKALAADLDLYKGGEMGKVQNYKSTIKKKTYIQNKEYYLNFFSNFQKIIFFSD